MGVSSLRIPSTRALFRMPPATVMKHYLAGRMIHWAMIGLVFTAKKFNGYLQSQASTK